MRKRVIRLTSVFWTCALALGAGPGQAEAPVAAIIMDDMGYNRPLGQRAANLPGALTYAVLPHTPHAKKLAEQIHRAGKEVILHAPMDNMNGRSLGPGALTDGMNKRELLRQLDWAIASIPHCRGINNHMGSLLTRQSEPMEWIMGELKQRRLFFVDSRTTGKSVAWKVARDHAVPYAKRDVFLDHDRNPEAIAEAFERLIRIAKSRGKVVAIGHPYPETLDFLEANLHRLLAEGIELSPASRLARQNWSREQHYTASRSTPPRSASGLRPASLIKVSSEAPTPTALMP